jgi:hypothetical protein
MPPSSAGRVRLLGETTDSSSEQGMVEQRQSKKPCVHLFFRDQSLPFVYEEYLGSCFEIISPWKIPGLTEGSK